jgi:hypothetical protein
MVDFRVLESSDAPDEPQLPKHRPKLMRTICNRAGVRQSGFPAMRHNVASHLARRQKYLITQISRLPRHQSQAASERYLQVVDPQLQEVKAGLEQSHTQSLTQTMHRVL